MSTSNKKQPVARASLLGCNGLLGTKGIHTPLTESPWSSVPGKFCFPTSLNWRCLRYIDNTVTHESVETRNPDPGKKEYKLNINSHIQWARACSDTRPCDWIKIAQPMRPPGSTRRTGHIPGI